MISEPKLPVCHIFRSCRIRLEVKKHLVFKKCYKDDKQKINGKQVFCERLHGYKLNEDDSDNDLEEDEM